MKARTVLGVAGGIVLLAALVAGAVFAANRGGATYPAGSPEAVVQEYFQALIDDRPDDAAALFADELTGNCPPGMVDRGGYVTVTRVVLDNITRTTTSGGADHAVVRVRVTERWGEPLFTADESTFTEVITLTEEGDGWRISEPPWPYFECWPVPTAEVEQ